MNQNEKSIDLEQIAQRLYGRLPWLSLSAPLLPVRLPRLQQIPSINFMRKQKRKERLRFMRRCRLRPCRLFRPRS